MSSAISGGEMSRRTRRIKRAAKRRQRTADLRALVTQIDTLIRPLGCHLSGIGPSAVGVQGDARTYGLSVIIRFPPEIRTEQTIGISTLITNRISRVTRVLREL
jgi:GMP synthase PP-ATPase subunit